MIRYVQVFKLVNSKRFSPVGTAVQQTSRAAAELATMFSSWIRKYLMDI